MPLNITYRMMTNNPYRFRILITLAGILLLYSCRQHKAESPPNIIVFLVDDLGWQDTSVPFHSNTTPLNQRYHTPNMERLAKAGMTFTQAYAACVCSPSRISLMTGMNAARHRVTNWTLRKDTKTDGKSPVIETPDWNYNGLNTEPGISNTIVATPLPQVLQQAGYTTIHIGKAHFAAMETPCADPLACGFDINVAGHAAGGPGSHQGLNNFGNHPDGQPNPPWSVPGLEKYHGQDINLTEALTREALQILDTVAGQEDPFFLYMAHYAVHAPIQPDKPFVQRYLDQGLDTVEARYASMVEGMDKSLGDILDFLEENDLVRETIVLFMSDNGGLSAVARGGQAHTHNAPLNSGKGSAYEGGVREPMIVRWPGNVPPGTTSQQPVIIEDYFPTLLDIAGLPDTARQIVDGISFYPQLTQKEAITPDRPLFWHYPNVWGPSGPGIGPYSAVRRGDWKLIYFHEDQRTELYNLERDIGETNDLSEQETDIRLALASLLGTFLRSVEAQMPIDKASGQLVPWPDEVKKHTPTE